MFIHGIEGFFASQIFWVLCQKQVDEYHVQGLIPVEKLLEKFNVE